MVRKSTGIILLYDQHFKEKKNIKNIKKKETHLPIKNIYKEYQLHT
jgi:hypothetical protein